MHISFRRYLSLLVTYLKPQWSTVVVMFVLYLLFIAADLTYPQVMKVFLDSVTLGSTSTILLLLALGIVGLVVFRMVSVAVGAYMSTRVSWTATNLLRRDLTAHSLSLDLSYHKARTPGEMIERIDGDVDKLGHFFSQLAMNLVTMGIFVLGVLVLFYFITWYVGVVMTIYVGVTLTGLFILRRRATPLWEQEREMSATFYGFLGERLSGTEDIRANGATNHTMRRFLLLGREWLPIFLRANRAGLYMFVGASFFFIAGSMLVMGMGAYLWSAQIISLGTVYMMTLYVFQMNYPLEVIQQQLMDLQQAEACIKRVEGLLNTKSMLQDGPGAVIPAGALSVEVQNVTFGYVEDEPVLHDLSFSVAPGKILGLLGRTGSGKTTIARLLFRLYDPQKGELRLGGVPLQQAHLRTLRQQIGMVTQDVQLFNASVRDNLTFFDRSIPDTQILEAIEDVGLSTWYGTLADGLDTVLGASGEGLSAGEAQLLAFTRVFLTKPGLVILDEASSRLDPATEKRIEQAVDKLLNGRTAIIIAHRLATLQRVDEILILENGRIVEYGDRVALASDGTSRFSHLLQTGLEEVRA